MKVARCECVSCGLPCIGSDCPDYEVVRYECDRCGEQHTLYEFDGAQLCIDCIIDTLEVVEGSGD